MRKEDSGVSRRALEAGEEELRALLSDLVEKARGETEQADRLCRSSFEALRDELERAGRAIAQRLRAGGRLYSFGGGESSINAAGIAALFARSQEGTSLAARSLACDRAPGSAPGNEPSSGRQLAVFARAGDIAMGYSTGGDRDDVIATLAKAWRRGLLTVGFTDWRDDRMTTCGMLDHCLVVASHDPHRIEEVEAALSHRLWASVQQLLEDDGDRQVTGRRQPATGQELLVAEEAP